MPITRVDITIASGELALEAVIDIPDVEGRCPGVALCHPHPRHGGNMHNGVVAALARSLTKAGIAALRFNFRGVGSSEGSFDRGVGELDDTLAAIRILTLRDEIDASRVAIAGYSFGAGLALQASVGSSLIQTVVSIACPMRSFRQLGIREILQPKLLVAAELDHDFPVEQFTFLARRFHEPKEVEVVYGADHFFAGHEAALGEMAAGFFGRCLGSEPV